MPFDYHKRKTYTISTNMSLLRHLSPLLLLFNVLGITFFEKNKKATLRNSLGSVPFLLVHVVPFFYIFSLGQNDLNSSFDSVMSRSDLIVIATCAANVLIRFVCNFRNRDEIRQLIIEISQRKKNYTSTYAPLSLSLFLLLLSVLNAWRLVRKGYAKRAALIFVYSANFVFIHLEWYLMFEILRPIHQELTAINERLYDCGIINFSNGKNLQKYRKYQGKKMENILQQVGRHYSLINLSDFCNRLFGINILAACASNFTLVVNSAYYITNVMKQWIVGSVAFSEVDSFLMCTSWCAVSLINFCITIKIWKRVYEEVCTSF